MRKVISLNQGWKFCKTADIPDVLPSGWESVSLPHTWNAEDGQDGGNDYWRGTAMYCRELETGRPEKNMRLFLEVGGAANISEVYVNGIRHARHEGGYSLYRTDITDALQDHNLICISVDNGANDYIYPQKADFTFYGGLYRDVNLIMVPRQHFELEKDGTSGIKVTPAVNPETCSADVTIETWQSGGDAVRISIGDQTVCQKITGSHMSVSFHIENVRLWNGTEDPYLYTAKAELIQNGETADEISVRFGCRTFGFDPEKGFILNGVSYPLHGVSRHQDRKGLGNALTLREHQEDMELIREIGANTIRLAHYQHAQEFYDLCDENGMIVWAEIPYITEHMPAGRKNTIDQMRELITQCYNHPSIVCWGLSNEVAVHGVSEDLMENHRLLNDLCHKMDPTRPTTMAHAFMLEHESPLIRIPDIGSYNLYFGWYLGTLEQNSSFFDEYHEKYPERIMGFSEFGADANVQFQTSSPRQGDYTEQYQCVYHEAILDCINKHPWLWSAHVWNMFDFAADGRDEGGEHGLNQKGLVSFDRRLKKDAFYLYKAVWNHQDPFVHICGSRYIDRAEEVTEIKVYSNQSSVTLLVDGKECGTQQGSVKFVFRIPLTGEHVITAVSGNLSDTIRIRKTEAVNPDYCFLHAGTVDNWFDEDDFDSSCFSIRDSFGTLMNHPETAVITGEVMARIREKRGDAAKSAGNNPNLQKMMVGMCFEDLLKRAGETISAEDAAEINRRLQQIRK
ncbi:MAG: hypothetical protein K6F23_14370 [Solobacterium sp.]|nr:hypothetical protein [Solobacterium sp.]